MSDTTTTTTTTTAPNKTPKVDKYGQPPIVSYKTSADVDAEKKRLDARIAQLKAQIEQADPKGRSFDQVASAFKAPSLIGIGIHAFQNLGGFEPGEQSYMVNGRKNTEVLKEISDLTKRRADLDVSAKRSSSVTADDSFQTGTNQPTATGASAEDVLYTYRTEGQSIGPTAVLHYMGQGAEDNPEAIWYAGDNPKIGADRHGQATALGLFNGMPAPDVVSYQPHAQQMSIRQAVAAPYGWSGGQLQQWAQDLWQAGFLSIPNYDLTKSFNEQYTPDKYDPAFQQAWQSAVMASMQDPDHSLMDIVQGRKAARAPMLEKAKQDAVKAKIDAAIKAIDLPDPVGIAQNADRIAQTNLRRSLTPEETQGMVDYIMGLKKQQVSDQVQNKQTTSIDTEARIAEKIQQDHSAELGAIHTSDAFNTFMSILGGVVKA